jgi:hypothetical protein
MTALTSTFLVVEPTVERSARAEFLATPEELEATELFLRKAVSDLAAPRVLAGAEGQDDHIVGFHAQQAVEKAFNAVVAVRSIEIPRWHDSQLADPSALRRRQLVRGIDQSPPGRGGADGRTGVSST